MAGNIVVAIVALDLLPSKERQQCVETLIKIHRNVHEYPYEPKYRTLNLTNKRFCSEVWNQGGGQVVMEAAGWCIVGNTVQLPEGVDVSTTLEILTSNRGVYPDEHEFNSETTHLHQSSTKRQLEEEQKEKTVKGIKKEDQILKKEMVPNVSTDGIQDEDEYSSYIAPVIPTPSYAGPKSSVMILDELTTPQVVYKNLHMTLLTTTKALAVLYKELTKVSPGRSVEDYCESTFGYNNGVFKESFSTEERDILSDPFWDPFQQNMTILMKLLETVCELESSENAYQKTSDSIAYHLTNIRKIRNDIVQCENFDRMNVKNADILISSLKISLSKILERTEELTGSLIKDNLDNILGLPVPINSCIDSMELIMAVQPNSPTTKALGVIYKYLSEIPSGLTVWHHKNRRIFNKIFSKTEIEILNNPSWNPSQQSVPFLYKMLQMVCGLSKHCDDKWKEPSDTIEYLLTHIKNIRNEIVNRNVDELDLNYIQTVIMSLQITFGKAFLKIEHISGQSTSKETNDLIIELDKILAHIKYDTMTAMDSSSPAFNEEPLTPIRTLAVDTASPLSASTTSVAGVSGTGPTITACKPAPITNSDINLRVNISTTNAQITTQARLVPNTNQNPTVTNKSMTTIRITEEDLNILRFFMGVRPKSPTAHSLAFVYTQLKKVAPGQTVEDYFKSFNSSKKNFNRAFNKDEQDILSDPYWDPYKQDVAFLYKMLQKVCGLFSTGSECSAPENIEYDLKIIKDLRNYLSHEAITLDDQELKNTFDKLKTSFENVFQKLLLLSVSSLKEHPATTKLNKLINNLDYILQSQVKNQLPLDSCDQLLAEARNERALLVFKWAANELREYYCDHLNSASPITWMSNQFCQNFMLIDTVFTDLEFLQNGFPINLENLLRLGRAVVIQGQPGIGKTTVVKHMARKWPHTADNISDKVGTTTTGDDSVTNLFPGVTDSENLELENTNMLLVMQCRYILSGDLTQYLKHGILKKSLKNVVDNEIIPLLNLGNITVMVDGWDEAKEKAKEVVYEALQNLSRANFLFTSRPEFTRKLEKIIVDYSNITEIEHVKIIGFSAEQRIKYVEKLFSVLNRDVAYNKRQSQRSAACSTPIFSTSANPSENQFLKYLEEKEDVLGEMTYVPLTLAFLIFLWNDDKESVSSVTSTTKLFVKLLEMMTGKLVERLSKKCDKNDYDLERKCKNWFRNELGLEAWNALQCNETCLSNKETLENCCEQEGLDILEMFSAFLISDRIGYSEDCQWSFRHKTIQEFCAACHLGKRIHEENICIISLFFQNQNGDYNLTRSNLYVDESEVILNFLCGLLSYYKRMTPERASQIIKVAEVLSDGYKIIGRLILESDNNPRILKCVENINFTIDEFQSSDSSLVRVLLEKTKSTLNDHVNIHVKKVTAQLLAVITEHCYLPVKPQLRLISENDLNELALNLQKVMKTNNFTECSTRLTLSTSHNEESFIGGNSKNVCDIISSRPKLAELINSHIQNVELPDDIKTLQEYIGEVTDDVLPEVQWLLKNTQCRLHPGTGRSLSEVIKLVEGLKDLIAAGSPSTPLPQNVRELWCSISKVNHADIPEVCWLMKHTRCRLFTWSRDNPLTGAHVHVQKGAYDLSQMIEPHFKSINRGVPLVFEFSSLDVLQTEGTSLVRHLFAEIPFLINKEELLIIMDVEFASPCSVNK